MKFTEELYEKAKNAKSAEELIEIAKAENVALTEEEAKNYFDKLHKTGELDDDELDNVSGGCGEDLSPDWMQTDPEQLKWMYPVGMVVKVFRGQGTFGMISERATVISQETLQMIGGAYYPGYIVQFADGTTKQVMQRYILTSAT